MDTAQLEQIGEFAWRIPLSGGMRVPGVLFASEELIRGLDDNVQVQVRNVASLPGIVRAAYAMPDAHWGYGFPVGGVAAFDPDQGGVVSAGGVGFDISCGVRTLLSRLDAQAVAPVREKLADALFKRVPAGVGSRGHVHLNSAGLDAMLAGGAQWAVESGFGMASDIDRIECGGRVAGADPGAISQEARRRQADEMGTLGSGNHYLEVQHVTAIYDERLAAAFNLKVGQVAVSIHCGSRGLGHQVATEFSRAMVTAAGRHGIALADRELACVPVRSAEGRAYLGAMRAAANCALANRQMLGHAVREVFQKFFVEAPPLTLLYDVSHNLCSEETHEIDGDRRRLFVHRKGATRAFGPGHPELADALRGTGQPVLVGGTMGTASYILAGTAASEDRAFSSACHGAGRNLSRTQALKQYRGQDVIHELARRNIVIRCESYRGVAEEAPGAYKDVSAVVEATHQAGLAAKVARLEPLLCIKG